MKTKYKYSLSLGLFAIFLVIMATFIWRQNESFKGPTTLDVMGKMPNITYYDKEAKAFHLADNTSKLTLLSFWASWCAPCIVEIPIFQKLYNEYKNDGFNIIAINLDDTLEEAEPIIQRLWKKHEIEFATYFDFTKDSAYSINLAGLPTNYLLNDKNEIIFESQGLLDWESKEIRNLIEEALR